MNQSFIKSVYGIQQEAEDKIEELLEMHPSLIKAKPKVQISIHNLPIEEMPPAAEMNESDEYAEYWKSFTYRDKVNLYSERKVLEPKTFTAHP